jgi:ankyrin repeat protein
LEAAFRLRQKEMFEFALSRGASLSDAKSGNLTLLEAACEQGALDWVGLLLHHRNLPNQKSSRGGDPLWWTQLRAGRPQVSELLVGSGADINDRLQDGKRPIEWAIEQRDYRLTRYLFGQGARATGSSLWGPMQAKAYDVMRLLAAHGDNPNNPTSTGFTLLGFAVMSGDVTAAALLMEYGARYEPNDLPGGHRLLEWAIANRQPAMAELLLARGADPNAKLAYPVTPQFLGKFTENGSLSFRLKRETQVTPIMLAAGSHQIEIAKMLMAKGASRSKPTGDYTYPVTFAINANDIPMAQLMLGREPEIEGKHKRKIVVSIDEQRARLYKDGEVLYSTECSTGREGFRTPRGTFVITDKSELRYSTLYGAAMPFFMRLSGSAVGMHQGNCPGYPASHGCIRLPYTYAKNFFGVAQVGDVVVVE